MKLSRRDITHSIITVVFLTGLSLSRANVEKLYELPYPHFDQLQTRYGSLQDAAFICMGFRSLAADVAWVQLLQYIGGPSVLDMKAGRSFVLTKDLTLRVMRIDPYFHRPVVFGAGLLAWLGVLKRPDEALEVLQEGIKYNPHHWVFQKYAAAIGYKLRDQTDQVIAMLHDAVRDKDTPGMIKSIVASSYLEKKKYREAYELYEIILRDKNAPEYHARAREKLAEIARRLKK